MRETTHPSFFLQFSSLFFFFFLYSPVFFWWVGLLSSFSPDGRCPPRVFCCSLSCSRCAGTPPGRGTRPRLFEFYGFTLSFVFGDVQVKGISCMVDAICFREFAVTIMAVEGYTCRRLTYLGVFIHPPPPPLKRAGVSADRSSIFYSILFFVFFLSGHERVCSAQPGCFCFVFSREPSHVATWPHLTPSVSTMLFYEYIVTSTLYLDTWFFLFRCCSATHTTIPSLRRNDAYGGVSVVVAN